MEQNEAFTNALQWMNRTYSLSQSTSVSLCHSPMSTPACPVFLLLLRLSPVAISGHVALAANCERHGTKWLSSIRTCTVGAHCRCRGRFRGDGDSASLPSPGIWAPWQQSRLRARPQHRESAADSLDEERGGVSPRATTPPPSRPVPSPARQNDRYDGRKRCCTARLLPLQDRLH